jgi:hypothetical protein
LLSPSCGASTQRRIEAVSVFSVVAGSTRPRGAAQGGEERGVLVAERAAQERGGDALHRAARQLGARREVGRGARGPGLGVLGRGVGAAELAGARVGEGRVVEEAAEAGRRALRVELADRALHREILLREVHPAGLLDAREPRGQRLQGGVAGGAALADHQVGLLRGPELDVAVGHERLAQERAVERGAAGAAGGVLGEERGHGEQPRGVRAAVGDALPAPGVVGEEIGGHGAGIEEGLGLLDHLEGLLAAAAARGRAGAVELGERAVDEGVPGGEQLAEVTVLAEDVGHEALGLLQPPELAPRRRVLGRGGGGPVDAEQRVGGEREGARIVREAVPPAPILSRSGARAGFRRR